MGISVVLRNLAETRNLTQKQIAVDLGIPASTMGGYFQGTSEPDLGTVVSLANYFGCSADYLLGIKSTKANSVKEDEILYLIRSMTQEQQALYLALGKALIEHKC